MMANVGSGLVHRLWSGWRAEIAAVLAPLAARARVLEVVAHDRSLGLALRSRGGVRVLGEVPLDRDDPARAADALGALIAAAPGRFDRLELRAAPGRGLSRSLVLPLAARAHLREAVGFDLDRQVPFSADMIHFGTAETGIDRAAGKVMVRLDVIPRAEIDPAIEALAAAGFRPDAVRLGAGDGPDIAPPEMRHRAPGWLRPAFGVGLAGAVLLGIAALLLPLHHARSALAEAEAAAQAARLGAAEAEAIARRIATLKARETALVDRRQSAPRALDLLAETTRLLPDGSYLVNFSLAGGKLGMTGYATRAAPLLGLIEQSELLQGARFTEPVVRDARMGAERFALSAELAARPAPAGVKP